MTRHNWSAAALAVLLFSGCGAKGQASPPQPAVAATLAAAPKSSVAPVLPDDGLPVLVNIAPDASWNHNPDDFTQGFLFADGALYESTGREGESKLRKLNADTGKVEQTQEIPAQHFGEGLASLGSNLYQLTWTSNVCLVYDRATLKPQRELFYTSQGWGLTVSPTENLFVFSDGSAGLRFLDPENFISKRRLTVLDGKGAPVEQLNELEWVNGEVWANVWMTDRIARIDPKTGKVLGWILFTDLVATHQTGAEDVLNGIAYDPTGDRLWITGKLWPKVYRFDGVKAKFLAARAAKP